MGALLFNQDTESRLFPCFSYLFPWNVFMRILNARHMMFLVYTSVWAALSSTQLAYEPTHLKHCYRLIVYTIFTSKHEKTSIIADQGLLKI